VVMIVGSDAGEACGLRVVTLNVWNRHGDWPRREAVLAAGLRALRPDVVFLQEVVVRDGVDDVRALLGPGYEVCHQTGREVDGSGCSVAVRWPVVAAGEEHLRVSDRVDPRELMGRVAWVEVAAPPPLGALLVVQHKPSAWLHLERERELQAVATARLVEDRVAGRAVHVVLAGDFDAVPDSAALRFWRGLQSLQGVSVAYRDAWATIHPGPETADGHTFSPLNPLVTGGNWPLETGRRIDYVLVRCDRHGPTLRIADSQRIFDAPVDGTWASDHFGVLADLEVP
jgi:endonuclease/exonuclease/phosphatase family metal-dependent hydrolase